MQLIRINWSLIYKNRSRDKLCRGNSGFAMQGIFPNRVEACLIFNILFDYAQFPPHLFKGCYTFVQVLLFMGG